MKDNIYEVEGNEYVFYMRDEIVFRSAYSITLCVFKYEDEQHENKITYSVYKHGTYENVKKAFKRIEDHQDIIGKAFILKGRFPVDELNKAINNTGYIDKFYQKLIDHTMGVEESIHPDIDEMNGY